MQKVTSPDIGPLKVIFYVLAIVFHVILLFTNVGNYTHGGTLVELLVLQSVAVTLVATAIKLLPKSHTMGKIFVVLCAAVPALSIIGTLVLAIFR